MFGNNSVDYGVPEHTKDAIDRYVKNRLPPGGFLTAVLSDKLFDAVGRADHINVNALPNIVKYIYNELPSGCHGSPEAVEAWLNSDTGA